ncbi:hypothetical protein [Rhodoferax sp.]|jgi:hypothetical protein|uniref:hypothetical protein n=1 Tax=Rhodoferax sp. TaxID=50421 RepID=UPI003784EECE
MKTCVVRLALALPALLWCGATFAQVPTDTNVVVPDVWDLVSTTGPDASDFAARCTGMPPAELQKMIKEAGSDSNVTHRGANRINPYLIINSKSIVCVKTSAKGFPILPIEVFRNTVRFNDMTPDQEKGLWTFISTELSLKGAAVALVKNSAGNAVQVVYLFSSHNPSRVYYQGTFLRATEFNESNYQAVFYSPGNVTTTSRGRYSENYKFIHDID